MHRMKQDTPYHHCGLPGESWDVVTRFIEGGIFVNLRRSLKRFTMINTRHPLTLSYAPSLTKLKQEEKLHLIDHYSMIHPLSMFSLYFNMIVAIVFINYFIFLAAIVALTENLIVLTCLTIPLNFFHTLLIIVTFFTGYYDDKQNIVLMNKKDVVKKYLRSYLITDIIAFIPLIMRFLTVGRRLRAYLGPWIILIRYFRFIWCLKVLKTMRLYYKLSIFMHSSVTLILNMVVALVLAVYMRYAVTLDRPTYSPEDFLGQATSTLKMLFLVDYGGNYGGKRLTITNLITPIVFLVVGFIFHLTITVQVMDIWFRFFSAENQQNIVYNSIDAYMRYKALPVNLRRRIYLYLEFKYQGHFYKDSVIRKATSPFLRREILLAATKESTQNVELFQKMPAPVLRKIRAVLVSEIFLPGDVIIKAGSPGHSMFFLVAGTVMVTNTEDEMICYLRDGSHFGELALIVNQPRVANVIAVSPCELYKLDRKSFSDIIRKYPELWQEIEIMAAERIVKSRSTLGSIQYDLPRTNSSGVARNL